MRRPWWLLAAVACARTPAPAVAPPVPIPVAAPPAPTCPATIGGTGLVGEIHPTWLELWSSTRGAVGAIVPADEQDARRRLCGPGGCSTVGPWLLDEPAADGTSVRTDLAFWFGFGPRMIVVPEVGVGVPGPCGWHDRVTLVDAGELVHVRRDRERRIAVDLAIVDGGFAPCQAGTPGCAAACATEELVREDRFFDRAGFQLLSITRSTPVPTGWPRPQLEASLPPELTVVDGFAHLPECAAPVPIPRVSIEPTATCPGRLNGEICDIHIGPSCQPGEHARALDCRPICVATAGCLIGPGADG